MPALARTCLEHCLPLVCMPKTLSLSQAQTRRVKLSTCAGRGLAMQHVSPAPGCLARTWLDTTTATPYSSASRCRPLRKRPRAICRADSSPRPLNSVLYQTYGGEVTLAKNGQSRCRPGQSAPHLQLAAATTKTHVQLDLWSWCSGWWPFSVGCVSLRPHRRSVSPQMQWHVF